MAGVHGDLVHYFLLGLSPHLRQRAVIKSLASVALLEVSLHYELRLLDPDFMFMGIVLKFRRTL